MAQNQDHSDASSEISVREIRLPTAGVLKIYIQGNYEEKQHRTVFLTCHDIGSNHRSFYPFLNHECMKEVRERSIFFHVCLPGQDDAAANLENAIFPSLDQIGQELITVLNEFELRAVVGIGEGAGANILFRFALAYPNKCLGVVLIHCTSATAGVVETVKEKVIKRKMSTQGSVNQMAQNFLITHKFGPLADPKSDAVLAYTVELQRLNAFNLAFYIEAFNKRTSLASELPNLKTDAILVVGSKVDDVNEVEKMHRLMNKEKTSRLVLENVGNVMLEAPEKFARALILFCKGCGLLSTVNVPGFERRSTLSSSPSTEEPGDKPRKMSTMAELDQPRKMSAMTKVQMGGY